MNKKKSKALAFLLAASLLVPSANGIVSAAELEGSGVAAVQAVDGSIATAESTIVANAEVGTVDELKTAVVNANGKTTIKLTNNITLSSSDVINIGNKNVTIVSDNNTFGLLLESSNLVQVGNSGVLKLDHVNITLGDSGSVTGILCTAGATVDMEYCKVDIENNGKSIGNVIAGGNSTIILKNNEFNTHIRAIATAIGKDSKIENNIFDLRGERFEYEENGKKIIERTGALSIVANDGESVSIINNTFKNANRAIGVDHSNMKGKDLTVEGNKFINTRFAFEINIENDGNNHDKNYNLSNNYFEFGGKITSPKVQNSEIKGEKRFQYASSSNDDNSSEIVLEAEDKRVGVYPYYSQLNEKGEIDTTSAVQESVAIVDGTSYADLKSAINAANDTDKPVVLQRNIDLSEKIEISKNVKIVSPEGTKYKIHLMGDNLIEVKDSGSLKLDNLELVANKDGMSYIYQLGALGINNCKFSALSEDMKVVNIIHSDGKDVPLILKKSEVDVNARAAFVAVGSGSVIENNKINLKNERYGGDKGTDRTSIISVVAKDDNKKVIIRDNAFVNANRGI